MIMERSKLNRSAHQKFWTLNPGTIALASIISRAFMTKVNSPRVRTFIGRVRIMRTGFINAFIRPITKAATIAAIKPETSAPGRI